MHSVNQPSNRTTLELQLGEQLNTLMSEVHALNVRTAAAFDPKLQSAAFLIVRWLLAHGPASASLLAESTAMDRSSVTRLVAQLKQAGYVHSEAHPEDRRGVLLSLTDLGRDKASEALQEKATEFTKRIAGWDDQQLTLCIEMLRGLNGR